MKTILCIEDESSLQKTLRDALEQKGYKIISALDGEAGLELAKKEKPDLVLLDLILPKLNGFGVLQELRASPETNDVPVIVLTNLEDIKDVDKAIELGATTYLVKTDYSLDEVIEKVKKALGEVE